MASIALATLPFLTSCQDEDFGYTSEEVRASVYDRNFIKYYGEIPENQSWDLSSYGLIERIKAARENSMTRGTGNFNNSDYCQGSANQEGITATYSSVDAFTESHDLVQWVKKRLQEGDRLQKYGVTRTNKEEFNQRFSMIATEESFQLMPVFQGIDNTIWDFHVVIEWLDENGDHHLVDRVLWKKSEGMTMKGERPNLLGESIQDYVPQFHSIVDLSTMSSSELGSDKNISPNNDVRYETTRLAADIKSQWVTVTGYPKEKAVINFYLHVLQDNDNVNSTMTNGKKFYSDCREYPNETAGNLVVLPVQVDIVQYQDREIVLMGCETALSSKNGGKAYNESEVHSGNTKHDYGDDDMNDIVFLLIGDETTGRLPKLISENEVAKRYFFEDLGSVVDWDFNDVVLDMKQVISIENSKKMITQTATLKHRCGTTPFNLFLQKEDGKYTQLNFTNLSENGKIPGVNEGSAMDRTETITILPREEFVENKEYPWRPEANNVAIKIYTNGTPYEGKAENEATNTSGNEGVWSAYQERYKEADGKHNIPRVFVADQSVWWTAEGQNFPNMWTYPSTAITTRPAGAEPNDYSSGSLYGIGSDRSFRYPFVEGDKLMLWNTPTFFDDWEPLWLSEGFMEGVSQGYNTVNIEFGDNNNTTFALLYRKDYVEVDAKFGGDNSWREIPSNKLCSFTLPATGDGSMAWYLQQKQDGYSPSFGIQDLDDYDGHNAGNYHIQINKVWMTKGAPADPEPEPQPDNKNFDITLGQNINFAVSDWGYNGKVSATQLQNINVGDKIVISVSNVNGAQIQIQDLQDWNNIVSAVTLNNGATSYTLNVTNENINNIKKGIAIMGHGFTITKVYVEPAEQPLDNLSHFAEGSVTLKNDPQTFDNWNGGIQIDKNSLNLGDVIIVHVSQAYASSQLGLRQDDGGWKPLNNNYLEYIEDITGDYEIRVDQTLLDAISNNSDVLIIQGKNLTVSKVTLRPAPVAPVALTGISLNVSEQDVAQGKTFQLSVTFNPANATNKNITWESNNTKVSVSNDGLVSVAADATVGDKATIIATSEDGGFTATCKITVIEAPASEVIWEGSISGQFQALAYGGQNNKQNGASKTLIECLDSGLTKLKFTFDKTSNVWYEILGAKENGTGGWHKLFDGNTNGSTLEVDLSSYVATIKTEDGIVLQGGDYGNLTKIEAYQ